ncbi:MAG: tRNA (adenine-N1)-methyltransferase [Candidatus Nanoarchaeia archaeon]
MYFLLIAPDGKIFLVQKNKQAFSTHLGVINLSKLKAGKIKSSTGQIFSVVKPTFADLLQYSKRGPAVVLPKDAAAIVMYSGLSCGDFCIDVGTGSGWLAAILANAVGPKGKVVTYETKKDFLQLAEKNFKFFGFKNIKTKLQDATQQIDEKNADLVTVDIAEPWLILPQAQKALKKGKFFVAYCPQITQVQEFVSNLNRYSFRLEKILEIHEREWKIYNKICRPQHDALTHTAFLVFARRI